MVISLQSASFSAHNRFYGIIKTPGNLQWDENQRGLPSHSPWWLCLFLRARIRILIQIATKSNLEIMNQRKYRGDPDWTGIDCVSRWLINLVSMLVVNSEYIRNTVDTDISTVYSLIWYNLDEWTWEANQLIGLNRYSNSDQSPSNESFQSAIKL